MRVCPNSSHEPNLFELIEKDSKTLSSNLIIDEILLSSEEKMKSLLKKEIHSLQTSDFKEELPLILGKMHHMASEHMEKDVICERKQWKKAWRNGDIKTLKKLKTCIKEIDCSEKELMEIAFRIKKNVQENKSSLFILPLNVVTQENSIMDILKEHQIQPIQIINNLETKKVRGIFYRILSKEGKEEGFLMGTIHVANDSMLRLNPVILKTLEKVTAIYLEVKPGGLQPKETAPVLPKDLQEIHKKKLKTFVEVLFPELISQLTQEGAAHQILNNTLEQFKFSNLEQRLHLVQNLLCSLTLHQAKIVHQNALFSFLSPPMPVGIDHLLAEHAIKENKETHGLEEDTLERLNLINEIQNEKFSSENIEGLPLSKEDAKQYISSEVKTITDLTESWISGNEELIRDYSNKTSNQIPISYKKLLTERDVVMASNIHKALENKKENETLLFAIGSAHVVGEGENVIRQLQNKGWKLERV